MRTKKTLLLAVLALAFSVGTAHADDASHTHSDSASSWTSGFGLSAGVSWGLGSMSSSKDTIQGRTMDTFGIYALPGYRVLGVLVGPEVEGRFVGQTTDPVSVGNTNLKGHGYLLGIGAEYAIPALPLVVGAGIDFIGKHSLSNQTIAGLDSSYSHPFGFRLKAGYLIIPMVSADFSLSYVQYSHNTLGSQDLDIGGNRLKHTNYALGISVHL